MYKRSAALGIVPDCTTCLDPDHPQQTKGRLKLVTTSSTLHHVQFADTYEEELMATVEEMGAAFHVDVDQISGGRLDDFILSFRRSYWDQPLPIDCAAVVGLNDVSRLTVDQFMGKLRKWREVMNEHSRIHGHVNPNTLAVATLLYAPKYYWHEGNPIDPPEGWYSENIKMRALTDAIRQFNEEGGVGAMVGLHTEGARKYKGKRQHRWETWREYHLQGEERDYGDFLHLVDTHRVKIHMKILKYFFHQTSFKGETAAVMEKEEVEASKDGITSENNEVVRSGDTEEVRVALSGDREEDAGARPGGTSPPSTGGDMDTVIECEKEIATGDTEMDIKLLYEPDGDQPTERVATIERVDTRMRELRELDEKLDEELMKNNEE